MAPRVSVVMPVRNGRPFLAEAIDSILKQTFRDLEFIVVDDGSTDGSRHVVEAFAQNDDRLRLIAQSPAGVTAALQNGVAASHGDLVARMDADDVAAPNRLSLQVEMLDQHPALAAVGSNVERIDPDGETIAISKWPLAHEQIDAELLRGRGALSHPTAVIRRDALQAVGGYLAKYPVAQDQDLWLRLAEYGRLANLPQPLLKYREHVGSVSVQRQQEKWELVCAAVQDACRRRGVAIPGELATSRRPSAFDHRSDWIHAAARAGNLHTAWKHASQLIRERPFAPLTWTAVARVGVYPLAAAIMPRRSAS